MKGMKMLYSQSVLNKFHIVCGICLFLSGCASTKYKHVNEIKGRILRSPTAIEITPAEFEKFKSQYSGHKEYFGMGFLGSMRGRGVVAVDPVFNKILYDPADSSLFIEGVVFEYFSKEPVSSAQIIFGKLPEGNKDSLRAKIEILYNYLIPGSGKFSTAFDLRDNYQLIFATKDNYSEDGEYMGAWVATIKAYDVYKLNRHYWSDSKK